MAAKPPPKPLIPENYLDVPTQRKFYVLAGAIIQGCKAIDVVSSFMSLNANSLYKWLAVDLGYCILLSFLRIPRLNYSKAVVALHIICLWLFDGFMFGGIRLNVGGSGRDVVTVRTNQHDLAYTPEATNFMDILAPFTFGLLSSSQIAHNDAHLLGQHTVRMSPISTAQLNPYGETFCLPSTGNAVLVPVLLNNTNPVALKYSITPLGHNPGQSENLEYSGKELRAIEQARAEALQLIRPAVSQEDLDEYDEYDDDPIPDQSSPSLQKTQTLVHIRLSKPGVVRLERVLDSSSVDARLVLPSDVTVVPCPRAGFAPDKHTTDTVHCAGQEKDMQLMMDISGVPPLTLRWSRAINARREEFKVEGIEGGRDEKNPSLPEGSSQVVVSSSGSARWTAAPEQLQVPLAVSLDTAGTHVYALEQVMDAVGNSMLVGGSSIGDSTNTNAVRSFTVLRRPTMSFKHCSPEHPVALAIGSEAALTVSTIEADALDAPWQVSLKYQPHASSSEGGEKDIKRYKPWRKTLSTQAGKRDISIGANAPGEYIISGVKGKWCSGDVLAPESCNVVEKPLPTAEIEWKKIHECSGDTGVSATLVLHGTPPFQVYYQTKKDSEAPRETSRTFPTSRGQFTLQPEQSGHYTFTFTRISDANYQRVDLNGPSIDQIIHPPASADFVGAGKGTGRKKTSTCEGSVLDVDVELRGSPPWNLEVQIVGPKSSEIVTFSNITTNRKTLPITIPPKVDKEGGTFEIDLVSIEDKSKCKLPISVPGISVNVRRLKPTVKFYGADGKRQVTVLENERVGLPLRLTGEKPWRMKYRLVGDSSTSVATLQTPNDLLHVTRRGIYEILEISDSQCPGSVIADASSYRVDWVPRPTAKLSDQTQATLSPMNDSYILPPICQGMDDHVDLDLTGRPPFQIEYNIAEGSKDTVTGTPVFHSIQLRTRFQLITSKPTRMYYEVRQIGDGAYPLEKQNMPLPKSKHLLFEQQVSLRPTAQFKNRNRLAYCLHDIFTPLDKLSEDGIVVLEGAPPFKLELSIKNLATSHVDRQTVDVYDHTWKVNLQSYQFQSIGPHLVVIESVSDASHCAHAALDPLATSIWVDVAETAAIVPVDRREDFCVGEAAQFQLEGTPPWSIGYRINGKTYTQEAKVSPFSLLQQQPGEFTVTSIAHQQRMCKASITDLRFSVHPLPSAQVGHGKRIYQDIHEGDQAEILFTLIGEPPFTFTYQRSELSTGRGKLGKVLETHTVSRIYSNEYSIFSALEGTWTVTSISDRYCRYPPTQPEVGSEKHRP